MCLSSPRKSRRQSFDSAQDRRAVGNRKSGRETEKGRHGDAAKKNLEKEDRGQTTEDRCQSCGCEM
jgi:hypothetical protein